MIPELSFRLDKYKIVRNFIREGNNKKKDFKMNLLFVTRFYPDARIGGIERVTGLLAKYFHEQGIQVHCLYFEKSEYDGSLGNVVQACRLRDLYDADLIGNYLKQNDIDVVINQSHFFYSPFLSKVVHEAGAKLITCCHSSTSMKTLCKRDAVKQSHGLKRMLISVAYPVFKMFSEHKLKNVHRASFDCSDKTIVLSKSIKKQYASILGIDATDERLEYICNPLSFDCSISKKNLADKENIVLVVARLYEPQKRLTLLFKAWQHVQRDDWKLVVVGDGEDRIMYEDMVDRLQLKNVSFEGVQNPISYYRKAKIFAMTSSWEGFPMTILESFQMGVVPVVMDSFPAAKDMIQDGENGYLVDDDISAFAKRLHGLMSDDELIIKMSCKARKSADSYNLMQIGKCWINVLNNL